MHSRVLEAEGRRVLVIRVEPDEEAVDTLTRALRDHAMTAAQVTAVGGCRSATLGYFDRAERAYRHIDVDGQHEVLSLIGDVAAGDDGPQPHLHAVLGGPDGRTVGGHLLAARVWPTLELIVTEVPGVLAKKWHPELGLALLEP